MNPLIITKNIASSFETKIKEDLGSRLSSLYLVGSYAYGKISTQRPDINYLLIFDQFTKPDDYLAIGQICRKIEEGFAQQATIKIEFRPFRYIKPRYQNELEVSVNPIIISTGEIKKMGGVIFNKWFTQGLKKSHRLILGTDYLKKLSVDEITKQDLVKGIRFDLMFFTIPISRAPAQYSQDESNLLLNESLNNAKNIIYLGIVTGMTTEELNCQNYTNLIENKEQIPSFYQKEYGDKIAKMVSRVLKIRKNYLEYKNNPNTAEEVFHIALNLGNAVRDKFFKSLKS